MTRPQLITAELGYADFASPPVAPFGVVVDGPVIVAVGEPVQLAHEHPDATRRDLTGVVLPGLIDCHVHLSFDGSADPVGSLQARDDDAVVEGMLAAATELVGAGVTTARELGSRGRTVMEVRDAIRAGTDVGPDLLVACRPLTVPRGHCWFFGAECADTAEMLRTVERHAELGAEWVKLVVSGGFLTDGTLPAEPQFDQASLDATVSLAHSLGLRVAAHAHSTAAIERSARAGVDTVEHATFLSPGGVDLDPDVVALLLDRGVAVCPTANAASHRYPAESGADALARIAGLADRGLSVVAGTDSGVAHVRPAQYAAGLHALHRAGMAAVDLLHAATAGAADALGVAGRTGRLAVGLRADLVAVAADPVHDLSTLDAPTWVMAAGEVVLDRVVGGSPTGIGAR